MLPTFLLPPSLRPDLRSKGRITLWSTGPQALKDAPQGFIVCVSAAWSITAKVDDAQLSQYPQTQRARLAATAPPLPDGWSSRDHSGLDAATPPPDLEASSALSRNPLGSQRDCGQVQVVLKNFMSDVGSERTCAVAMFNILACNPR